MNATGVLQYVADTSDLYNIREMLFSGARTARMTNRRKRLIKNKNMQFHRRRTSKYEFRRGPESDPSEEPKISVSGRLQNSIEFLVRTGGFRGLLAAGKPGADLGRFGTPPGRVPRDGPIRPANPTTRSTDDDQDDRDDQDDDRRRRR